MQGHCSKCGAQQELPWKFCPHCGTENALEMQPKETEQPEKSPAPGAFSGLLFGMLAVPILVIVGTMLCLTGLGAILGIPMIIAAVFAPLLGPMIGMGALKGKCPWCGIAVSSVANTKDFNCHGCGRRIAIRHREFVAAA
jgi:DNA-directed RNA polymerase subunit RPC12/RpoP